jgi:hypothetical protein
VRVSLKSVVGVDAVDVSLDKGLAVIKLKPGNTATLKQLQEAITRNGFTMKQSNATVAGQVFLENGKAQLKVSGSNDVLNLLPENQTTPDVNLMNGKSVVIQGVIPEPAKNKVPDSIRYHSAEVDQK